MSLSHDRSGIAVAWAGLNIDRNPTQFAPMSIHPRGAGAVGDVVGVPVPPPLLCVMLLPLVAAPLGTAVIDVVSVAIR